MQVPMVASVCALIAIVGCTGLVAGPETSAVTPVPASRDSAYVRARRALQAESFTVDIADSTGGHLTATRYPSSTAKAGSSASCRVRLALDVQGDQQQAEVAATSQWLASEQMEHEAPQVCDQERSDVLSRISQTLNPPTP
jgi:hypothetical protein